MRKKFIFQITFRNGINNNFFCQFYSTHSTNNYLVVFCEPLRNKGSLRQIMQAEFLKVIS